MSRYPAGYRLPDADRRSVTIGVPLTPSELSALRTWAQRLGLPLAVALRTLAVLAAQARTAADAEAARVDALRRGDFSAAAWAAVERDGLDAAAADAGAVADPDARRR